MKLVGEAIKYGDDISTDLIIAGKHTKTLSLQDLGDHAMEDLDPDFHKKIKGSGIIVAGNNFGCGSSREGAAVALQMAGVTCIVAKSFARIFYRNAINIGLTIVECNTDLIDNGDIIEYTLGDKKLFNNTTYKSIEVSQMPDLMFEILKAGGITAYFKNMDTISR